MQRHYILISGTLQSQWLRDKCEPIVLAWASLVAQRVKNQPAMWETWVRSLDQGIAAHSSIHAWRIPWTEDYSIWDPMDRGLQFMGQLCLIL